MTIERHDSHPPEVICRPAGNGLCEPLRIQSRVPDLDGVTLEQLGRGEEPQFSSSI